jgi:hypothetical protein
MGPPKVKPFIVLRLIFCVESKLAVTEPVESEKVEPTTRPAKELKSWLEEM